MTCSSLRQHAAQRPVAPENHGFHGLKPMKDRMRRRRQAKENLQPNCFDKAMSISDNARRS